MKKICLTLIILLLAVAPAFAQKSFDMRYNEAVEYFTTKDYNMAIKTLEAAKKAPGVTRDQLTKAEQLIRQCRSALSKLSDLNLSKDVILAPGEGKRDSLYVTAGRKWSVTFQPPWVSTHVESDVLFVTVDANETKNAREDFIEVTMGKERVAYISVKQEAVSDVVHTVYIHTSPERAFVSIDQKSGILDDRFSVSEGQHAVRIYKEGYERIDTVITVPKRPLERELHHRFQLVPTFALMKVDVKPEEGMFFDMDARLDISGNTVDLKPVQLESFNKDQGIKYYQMYEDNFIPLHPGRYVIRIEAQGFKPAVRNVELIKGQTFLLDVTLNAKYGLLTVQDGENAKDAKVIIDDKYVGNIPYQGRITTGRHVMRVEKSGYVSEHERYEFDVEEGREVPLNVAMSGFCTYQISSDPAYCKVSVDGNMVGTTPVKVDLKEGHHVLTFSKDGYLQVSEDVLVDGESEVVDYKCSLEKIYPISITSDQDSLKITVSKGRGKNRVIYVDNVKTPAVVELPASKTMYRVKLTRSNLSKAYDGYFWFMGGKRDHINLLSYSLERFNLLGVNYYLKRPAPYFGDTPLQKEFQRVGDVSFAELMLFPGMTTCAVKGSLFWPTDIDRKIHYPANASGAYELLPDNEFYQDVSFLPALSVLFLNGEFRLGGALHNNVDIDLMATYAWYPDISKVFALTHISGHDIFVGGEISSRIPIFNVNIKAGLQAFYGQANICRPSGIYKSSANVKDRFYAEPYTIPYNDAQFVVTVGFKLGGRDSKGNNILRVF